MFSRERFRIRVTNVPRKNRVAFNPPWCFEGFCVEHEEFGERLRFEEQGGLHVLHAKVAPQEKQTSNLYKMHKDFHRQVDP